MKTNIKLKKCVICGNDFTPRATTQKCCGWQCALDFAEQKKKEDFKKQAAKEKRKFYDDDVKHQHKLTKTVFNKLRVLQELKWFSDRNQQPVCISCGKENKDWCCGHFKTVGSQGNLRYDKLNTYLQCNRYCNMALSGNIYGNKTTRGYIRGLYDRFGDDKAKEIIDYCETSTESKKWTAIELRELRAALNKQIREIEVLL